MNDKAGIIIQARRGSTRFPDKVIRLFYNGSSILELLLKRFKDLPDFSLCVATTLRGEDDFIAEMCRHHDVNIYRGPTDNVLERFLGAALKFNIDPVIRICSDNPFVLPSSVTELVAAQRINRYDYIGYKLSDNRIGIKTHFGLWAELISVPAMAEVLELKPENEYFEHVTNYLYSHPEKFNNHLIEVPEYLFNRKDIRLTVDTEDDFLLAEEIYKAYFNMYDNLDPLKLIELIDKNERWKRMMMKGIVRNEK